MIKVKRLQMWNMSLAMIVGRSPKIKYICGKCDSYNEARIPIAAIEMGRPYVICSCCGEINDTGLTIG